MKKLDTLKDYEVCKGQAVVRVSATTPVEALDKAMPLLGITSINECSIDLLMGRTGREHIYFLE